MYYSGQACSTSYLTATVMVNVSTLSSGSVPTFEQASFLEAQRPMTASYLDTRDFENEFIRQTGATHLHPSLQPSFDNVTLQRLDGALGNFEGPALLLAIGNNYSVDGLMQMDPIRLAKRAAIIKQRFLGEVLLSQFSDLASDNKTVSTQTLVTERHSRLVVNLAIGIILGLVFYLLAGAAASLAFLATLKERPLQLMQDPQKSVTAALLLSGSKTSTYFQGMDGGSSKEIAVALEDQSFSLNAGRLESIDRDSDSPGLSTRNPSLPPIKRTWLGRRKRVSTDSGLDWRPFNLKKRSGALLFLVLMSVTATLVAVYCVSKQRPLYQSIPLYRSDLNLGDIRLATIAPYSIVPTLVAVGLKLWWATIDSAYRRLAPLVTMTRVSGPKASNGVALSYVTTPIIWITHLALRNGHWLLAVVTFSTLTSEILQVSMSALWERKATILELDADLSSQLELRSVPHIFRGYDKHGQRDRIAYPKIAQHLYGGELYQTSWIYGGLAESAFGAFPPAWSKDGWNFPPVDITSVLNTLPELSSSRKDNVADPILNVTFDSVGLRGRVECTPIDNTSRWFSERTVTWSNGTREGYYFNASMPNKSPGFEFTPEVRMVELPWTGSSPKVVTIGQWLHSNYSSLHDRGDPLYKPTNSRNFTVLWIQANYPIPANNSRDLSSRRIWAQRPQIQALNCRPLFETSKFRIVVNAETNQVRHYSVLEPVREATSAWTDGFTRHIDNITADVDPSKPGSFNGSDARVYNMTVR